MVSNLDDNLYVLPHPVAGAVATADATVTTFLDDFRRGVRRVPQPSECQAAASASASAFSSASGGDAFSFAKAQAQASGLSWGSAGWRNAFTGACLSRASASASAGSFGGNGGSFGFAGELVCC